MLSAIEIYNKPNFSYREETFAILAVNAWELLLKAHLLKCCSYKMEQLYVMEHVLKKDGTKHPTRKKPKLNRAGNATTIGILEVIKRLDDKAVKLNPNLKSSIEALIELRDNAIHFHNEKQISKEIQELGFACIKNYMSIIKLWEVDIDLSIYNFYLMPLAYVDSRIKSESVMTDEVSKYLSFIKNIVQSSEQNDEEFTVAISIDINFKKSKSFESIGMRYDPEGVAITLSEEDIRDNFPLTTKLLTDLAKKRYSDFKQGQDFHKLMREIKKNTKLCHERKLDPLNPKSSKMLYYSTNIWKELDKNFSKKHS